MEVESSRLLPANHNIDSVGLHKRRGKTTTSGALVHIAPDDVSAMEPPAGYFLIREPEVLDSTKRARIAALPILDRVKYIFSGNRHLELGKYEDAPYSLIERSLGPEIYRASINYDSYKVPINSAFYLRGLGASFKRSPEKVNNAYASAKYDSFGNLAFVRMWCDSTNDRMEIRLHDAARKPNPPAGKRPMTRRDLCAFERALKIISDRLQTDPSQPRAIVSRVDALPNVHVCERLVD